MAVHTQEIEEINKSFKAICEELEKQLLLLQELKDHYPDLIEHMEEVQRVAILLTQDWQFFSDKRTALLESENPNDQEKLNDLYREMKKILHDVALGELDDREFWRSVPLGFLPIDDAYSFFQEIINIVNPNTDYNQKTTAIWRARDFLDELLLSAASVTTIWLTTTSLIGNTEVPSIFGFIGLISMTIMAAMRLLIDLFLFVFKLGDSEDRGRFINKSDLFLDVCSVVGSTIGFKISHGGVGGTEAIISVGGALMAEMGTSAKRPSVNNFLKTMTLRFASLVPGIDSDREIPRIAKVIIKEDALDMYNLTTKLIKKLERAGGHQNIIEKLNEFNTHWRETLDKPPKIRSQIELPQASITRIYR